MAKRTFKVKKKLSKGRTEYRAWKDWDVGDIMIGQFVAQGEDQYDKPNWVFKVVDAQFENAKVAKKLIGKAITLNSNGQLDKAMKKVEEGELIQVTYNGMAEITKGKYKGKESHLVEVDMVVDESEEEIDEDEELDEDDEDTDDEESDDDESDDEDEDDEDEDDEDEEDDADLL